MGALGLLEEARLARRWIGDAKTMMVAAQAESLGDLSLLDSVEHTLAGPGLETRQGRSQDNRNLLTYPQDHLGRRQLGGRGEGSSP
jgi:hypothetical protein